MASNLLKDMKLHVGLSVYIKGPTWQQWENVHQSFCVIHSRPHFLQSNQTMRLFFFCFSIPRRWWMPQRGFELFCLKMRCLFLIGRLLLVMIHYVKLSLLLSQHEDGHVAYEKPCAHMLTCWHLHNTSRCHIAKKQNKKKAKLKSYRCIRRYVCLCRRHVSTGGYQATAVARLGGSGRYLVGGAPWRCFLFPWLSYSFHQSC